MVETKAHTPPWEAHPPGEQFERWESALVGSHVAWVREVRREGMDRYRQLGLPTPKLEDWRFTPLTPLLRLPFRPLVSPRLGEPAVLDGLTFSNLAEPRFVFVDGRWVPELSSLGALPAGVSVRSLAALLAAEPDRLDGVLGRLAPTSDSAFTALNAAYFCDGAVVEIAPGTTLDLPIHLLYVSRASEPGAASHLRNLVRVGAGARVTLLENYLSLGRSAHVTNTVTEIEAADETQVEHIKFQDENLHAVHVGAMCGEFGRASRVFLHSFALGARLARNNFRTRLAGEGLECILNGLYLTKGEQLADHHMVVEHTQPHGASHEYFNGILDDKSRGVFHGRILVHPLAQKTDAKQTNRNLLLSDEAAVDTKPQLEIHADDVRCTHGATVGQLNEDSIFYLRSRGIGLQTARRILIHAFAGEITERVQCERVREQLDRLVWDRLEQNPHVASVA